MSQPVLVEGSAALQRKAGRGEGPCGPLAGSGALVRVEVEATTCGGEADDDVEGGA